MRRHIALNLVVRLPAGGHELARMKIEGFSLALAAPKPAFVNTHTVLHFRFLRLAPHDLLLDRGPESAQARRCLLFYL